MGIVFTSARNARREEYLFRDRIRIMNELEKQSNIICNSLDINKKQPRITYFSKLNNYSIH